MEGKPSTDGGRGSFPVKPSTVSELSRALTQVQSGIRHLHPKRRPGEKVAIK